MARKKLFSVREPAIFFLWFVIGSRYAEPLATRRRSISWSFPSSASRMSFESCCFVSLYGVHNHLTVSASAKHRPPEDAKDEALRIFKYVGNMFALCSTVDASRARRDGRHLSPVFLLRAMCGSRKLIHPDASRDEMFVKRLR